MIPRRIPYFASKTFAKIFKGQGNAIQNLENDLKKYFGLPNPLLVSSGRAGLKLILEFANLRPKSDVIIPGFTFGELTKTIKAAGLTPKPVDIDPNTFQMDPKQIKKAINSKTSAILATHLFGEPCAIKEIKNIAKRHRLFLIEDCAESLGAKVSGKLTGTFGDVAFSSFNIAKPLQGITGGVIFGKNKKIISEIRKNMDIQPKDLRFPTREFILGLSGYCLTQTPFWFLFVYLLSFKKIQNLFVKTYRKGEKSTNLSFNLPSLSAKIVSLNLPSLISRIKKRQHIRNLYYKHLGGIIEFQKNNPKNSSSVYMIVGTIDSDPLLVRRGLALKGIDIAIHEEIADDCLEIKGSNTENAAKSLVSLPIYESLTAKQVRFIADTIKDLVR